MLTAARNFGPATLNYPILASALDTDVFHLVKPPLGAKTADLLLEPFINDNDGAVCIPVSFTAAEPCPEWIKHFAAFRLGLVQAEAKFRSPRRQVTYAVIASIRSAVKKSDYDKRRIESELHEIIVRCIKLKDWYQGRDLALARQYQHTLEIFQLAFARYGLKFPHLDSV